MIAIDVLVGAICTLVFVLNELWSDKSKTRLVYHQMPSDAVFSDIASGKIDAAGFDLETAQKMYGHMATRPQICRLLSGTSCFRRVEFLKWGM